MKEFQTLIYMFLTDSDSKPMLKCKLPPKIFEHVQTFEISLHDPKRLNESDWPDVGGESARRPKLRADKIFVKVFFLSQCPNSFIAKTDREAGK